jgi:uncharacterized protein
LLLDVVVKPRSSRVKVGPMVEGRLQVSVTAPPVDGAANAAVIEALAEALGVPKRAITIVRGETGRKKTVRVEGVTAAAVKAAIG